MNELPSSVVVLRCSSGMEPGPGHAVTTDTVASSSAFAGQAAYPLQSPPSEPHEPPAHELSLRGVLDQPPSQTLDLVAATAPAIPAGGSDDGAWPLPDLSPMRGPTPHGPGLGSDLAWGPHDEADFMDDALGGTAGGSAIHTVSRGGAGHAFGAGERSSTVGSDLPPSLLFDHVKPTLPGLPSSRFRVMAELDAQLQGVTTVQTSPRLPSLLQHTQQGHQPLTPAHLQNVQPSASKQPRQGGKLLAASGDGLYHHNGVEVMPPSQGEAWPPDFQGRQTLPRIRTQLWTGRKHHRQHQDRGTGEGSGDSDPAAGLLDPGGQDADSDRQDEAAVSDASEGVDMAAQPQVSAGSSPPRHNGSGLYWLNILTTTKRFFKPCRHCEVHHPGSRDVVVTWMCLDEPMEHVCNMCKPAHAGHSLLQVRRSTYHDVIKVDDIASLLDLTGMQLYTINGARVVFLQPRPQSRPPKGGSAMPVRCVRDGRHLMDPSAKYCSLRCKLDVEGADFLPSWPPLCKRNRYSQRATSASTIAYASMETAIQDPARDPSPNLSVKSGRSHMPAMDGAPEPPLAVHNASPARSTGDLAVDALNGIGTAAAADGEVVGGVPSPGVVPCTPLQARTRFPWRGLSTAAKQPISVSPMKAAIRLAPSKRDIHILPAAAVLTALSGLPANTVGSGGSAALSDGESGNSRRKGTPKRSAVE